MKIIVGLGNPGVQYETTRHNVGFLAIDRLIESWNASEPTIKYKGEIYSAQFEGEKVLLVKPQTFMNLSGQTVGPLFQFYQLAPQDMIVIHDELDLPPFALRIKTGGGSGGHNGIKSIDEHLGKVNQGYHRIRIGIGNPRQALQSQENDSRRPSFSVSDYVLKRFPDQDLKTLSPLLDDVARAAEEILRGRIQEAMNKYNRTPK